MQPNVSRSHFGFLNLSSMTAVVAFESEPTNYAPATTPQAHPASPRPPQSSLLRQWYAIRWHLARTIFAKPVPFLTEKLELKLGDCLVTMPVAAAFIAVNASACHQRDVSGSGGPAAIIMLLVFALAIRNNSILLMATGLPFERVIYYHKFFGGTAWIVAGLHGLTYLLQQSDFNSGRRLQHHGDESGSGTLSRQFSGALMFYSFSALMAFAFEPIRRCFYELFHRMHWIFFLLVVIFGVIHGAGLILFGFVPWALDMLYRFACRVPTIASKNGGMHTTKVTVKLVTKDIVRIQFPRPFHYEAGQYVFVCLPRVARLEWHPFTISSAPHEPHITIHIKVLGDWTKKLAAVVIAANANPEPFTVLVDGPYGAVGLEMDRYSHLICLSGGIGITPMKALANDVYYKAKSAKTRRTPLEKVRFVWAVRDRDILQALLLDEAKANMTESAPSWFPSVLASASNTNSDTFVADIYLTNKEKDLSDSVDQQLALYLKHKQKPNVSAILREVGEAAQRTKSVTPVRIGVLVCGPAALSTEAVVQSQLLTKELGIAFDVHTESFAW